MSHSNLSAMDFLKSCATGVQTLTGFTSVFYHVYTLERKDDSAEKSLDDGLLFAEASLRAWKRLVYVDTVRRALWTFDGGGNTEFAEGPELSKISMDWDFALKSTFQGSFKASELSHCFSRASVANNHPPTPVSASPSTPTAALRAAQLANLRAFQHNAANLSAPQESTAFPQTSDVRTIYTMFISAVSSTLAYQLSRYNRSYQLDMRTFVHKPALDETLVEGQAAPVRPLHCFTLDIYLTSGGTLVISIGADKRNELYDFNATDQLSKDSLLAPGGLPATIMDGSVSADDAETIAWKDTVRQRLEMRGIHLTELDPEDRWTMVCSWPELLPTYASADTSSGVGLVFYWPQALCFRYSLSQIPKDQGLLITSGNEDPKSKDIGEMSPLAWFYPPDQGGFTDPLRFAEEWFRGKAERDKIIDNRKRKRKEAEAAQKQVEAIGANVASPFYTRGDLQAAAGVYPTPPDGILSQATSAAPAPDVAAISAPLDSQVPRTSIDFQTSEIMDIDMAVFGDGVKQRPSIQSRNSLQLDPSMRMGDDLFGDIDEEDYGGNDITDADFSFFDEPDVADTDMLEPSASTEKLEDIKAESEPIHEGDQAKPNLEERPQLDASSGDGAQESTSPRGKETSLLVLKSEESEAERVIDTPYPGSDTPRGQEVRILSPLSPTSVRKKLFEFALDSPVRGRRHSQFEPVPFNTSLVRSDTKYNLDGAFAFKTENANGAKRDPPKLDNSLSLSLPPKKKLRLVQESFPGAPLSLPVTKEKDSDDSSATSDASSDDDDSLAEFEALSLVPSPLKGIYPDKRLLNLQEDEATSVATSPGNYIVVDDTHAYGLGMNGSKKDQLDLFGAITLSTISRVPSPVPRPHKPDGDQMLMLNPTLMAPTGISSGTDGSLQPTHKDFILVAQTIAEQMIFRTMETSHRALETLPDGIDTTPYQGVIAPVRTAQAAIKSSLSASIECDLLKFLCVQDYVPEKAQASKVQQQQHPLPRKPTVASMQASDGSAVPASVLSALPPPHVRVRRNEGLWDVLPPALPFWEHLGLAPTSGRKNVMAFCIYPGYDDLRLQVSLFLDYLSASYESCRLGAHVRTEKLGSFSDGLVPVSLAEPGPFQSAVARLREVCVQLGRALASVDWQRNKITTSGGGEELSRIDNFVIYLINPFDDRRGIAELCSAFWLLYHTYGQASRSPMLQGSRPDLVLQLIPIRHVASPFSPVVPESSFFQKLAREVYDRCPPAVPNEDPSKLRISSAACIQLEQSLPKKIQFQLTAEPPSDLLHENSHLHLGYAKSKNGEWLTVAWTDNSGRYQATTSYCLLGGRTFYDVAREIWGTTVEIMQARRVAWRLCIAKAGPLAREELDAWSSLSTSASPITIITVITSIDPSPPLAVFPKAVSLSSEGAKLLQPFTQTPVGTPQAGVSPDTASTHALTPAATPSAATTDAGLDLSNDPDAHLVDVGDETFGLILGHKTNISGSLADFRPSLSSGYLMKTNAGSPTPLDDEEDRILKGPILVGVNLVWIGSSPRNNGGNAQSPQAQQSPQQGLPSSSPMEQATGTMPAQAGPSTPTGGASTSSNNIPKATADGILKEYLASYRNLGVLARARGLRGTKRGSLPWHVVVALRGVEGLENVYGRLGG